MSTVSRVIGHGMGGFFMLLGAVFLVLALNDNFLDSLTASGNCASGDCGEDSVRTTFLILGASFLVTGAITSLGTELAIRKTRRLVQHVTEFRQSGSLDSMEGLSEFLKPFGVSLDPGSNANINVERRTIDLRGQRSGDVPSDPAGLSAYLKSMGVSLDEDVLRNARVVRDGQVVSQGQAQVAGASGSGTVPLRDESRRETARIVRKRDRGATAGNQRLVEFDLEVTPAGKVPYQVQVASLVRESLASLLIEGSTLNVRVDPTDPNAVTIDWSEN